MTHFLYEMLRFPASLSNKKFQSPVISDIGSIEAVLASVFGAVMGEV